MVSVPGQIWGTMRDMWGSFQVPHTVRQVSYGELLSITESVEQAAGLPRMPSVKQMGRGSIIN